MSDRRKLLAGILLLIFFIIALIGEAMADRIVRFWLGVILCCGVLLVVACFALVGVARAHDHEHPELTDWYMSLYAKGGAWCCNGDDADTVEEWETKGGHYRAKIDGSWIDIPDDAVVEGPNRAGQAKIWLMHLNGEPAARCFIPGSFG